MSPGSREEDGLRCAIEKHGNREHWCLLTDEQAATIDGWAVAAEVPYISKSDQTLMQWPIGKSLEQIRIN